MKIKTIASAEKLPDDIKSGVPKPELEEEDRITLHNVTSSLYNKPVVKEAMDKAIQAVCIALGVDLPGKGKRVRKGKEEKEDKETAVVEAPEAKQPEAPTPKESEVEEVEEIEEKEEDDEETDFDGFGSDDDDDVDDVQPTVELDSEEEVDEEDGFSRYSHLLGSSSEDDSDADDDDLDRFAKYRGTETVNLDDISVSGSASEGESNSDDEIPKQRQPSLSSSPEPQKKKVKKIDSKTAKTIPTGSTFLPTLMGGYISGSESASDIDVAPTTKRRGQRARRAIWEKKYGSSAKHLVDAAMANNRDNGWDMKRGAVGADDGRRTPWKKGVSNPFDKNANVDSAPPPRRKGGNSRGDSRQHQQYQQQQQQYQAPPRPPPKKDDEGALHPSWEARKKAKESQKGTAFAGAKITFD